eukprot:TCALIF_07879-PA protein Name:"Similar to cwf19l2 CWF19-like protein 2 (Xenopus tropicalis)" AED:0.03 eAED:0.04 QI:26/1/0.5/1/0/0/2/170/654
MASSAPREKAISQKALEKKQKEEENEREWKKRELNPQLRDSGKDESTNKPTKSIPSSVGDGGASWLLRAMKRAKEQAEREGRSLEEVAAERWGSLGKFEDLLAKAQGGSRRRQDERSGSRRLSPERSKRRRPLSRSPDRDRKKMFARPDEESKVPKQLSHSFRESSRASGSWKTSRRRDEDMKKSRPSPRRRSSSSGSSSSSDSRSRSNSSEKKPSSETTKPKTETLVQETVDILTETEMNALGAKIIKAEIMGSVDLVNELKAKLARAKDAKALYEKTMAEKADTVREETVILTKTDSKGFTRPVESSVVSAKHDRGDRRRKAKVDTHDKDGKRERYFADDDKFSLKEMFEREKLSTAEDQNAMMNRLAGKSVEKLNEDYDLDDMFTARASKKENESKSLARERERAVAEEQKRSRTLDSCKFCFEGTRLQKHLIVAIGKSSYLSLPHHVSLTEGHCLLLPLNHVSCATLTDEDIYDEIQEFRRCLVRMFAEDDQDCVFFEHADRLKSFPHMILECVPIPRELGDMAPMYFQKAIQECESEWSNNKKLINLRDKPLKRAVPKGLPYFHVDFGLDSGFAHVIEDEALFPRNFAQEIIGGMLDLEPRVWRNPKRENFDTQKKKVLAFGSKWEKFDFTRKKDQKSSASSSSDSETD